jgi:Na+-translocating ferredoxin:NAD+ oxidoreductase RnfC subunit
MYDAPRREALKMRERVRENGVVGAGGAGFPSYVKLEKPAEIVIMNAAECEPLLHKDKQILTHFTSEVLSGMDKIRRQVKADRAIIGIKEKYHELIEILRAQGGPLGIEVSPLGDFYPAGDEFLTVYETTKRVIPPGGIPLDVGCLVMNVETMLNVQRDRPVTHKYLSIAGEVPEPVTLEVPVGTPFREVFTAVGVDVDQLHGVLVGGVMMGRPMKSLDEVVTRTTGALLVFPAGHVLLRKYAVEAPSRDRIGKAACDQCSFCTELCPRYLLGHPVQPHMAMRGLEFNHVGDSLILGSQFCCECNLCSLYSCPEDLFPKDACADNKVFMRSQALKHPATGRTDLQPHRMQEYRKTPVKSLFKKLGLNGFRNVGPLVEVDWNGQEVRIPLKMHIGAPARAVVKVGDLVQEGQVIGAAPEGLGVPVHASVHGTVTRVADEITLRRIHG